jgi:hypothetical protein
MPFVALRDFRNLAKSLLPLLSADCRDILIELAAAQQLDQCLTMKQLVLLQSGTATTVRRRVTYLIELGHVVKMPNQLDGRSDRFGVSKCLWAEMSKLQSALLLLNAQMVPRVRALPQRATPS